MCRRPLPFPRRADACFAGHTLSKPGWYFHRYHAATDR